MTKRQLIKNISSTLKELYSVRPKQQGSEQENTSVKIQELINQRKKLQKQVK